MEEIILRAVSDVGIPTAIAFYVLVKLNATLDKLTQAVNDIGRRLDQYSPIRYDSLL